jgi:hypothetical protein
MGKPNVFPTSVDFVILREGVSSRMVQLSSVEVAATAYASLLLDDTSMVDVRITELSVLQVHTVVLDNPDPLPPGVPPLPPQTEQVLVVVAQSTGSPLRVEAGQFIQVRLSAQRTSSAFTQAAGSLVIHGDTWTPISIPVTIVIGSDVQTTFASSELSTRQGQSPSTSITAELVSGPSVDVRYELVHDAQSHGITMEPVSLRVPTGKPRQATLVFDVDLECPVGNKFIRISRTGGVPREDMIQLRVLEALPKPPDTAAEILATATRRIDEFFRRFGGEAGRFGFALEPVRLVEGIHQRRHAGGLIKLMSNGPRGYPLYVQVRYVGFVCVSESSKISGSEEPYFLLSAVGTNGSNTIRVGPYEDVDGGESVSNVAEVCGKSHGLAPPIALGIIAMEHDNGTPEEAEGKVREKVQGLVNKIEAALGSFAGLPEGTHVIPEWMRDILIGWIPEGIAAVFGMGDDHVGGAARILFDNRVDLAQWTQMPVLGDFQGNAFNARMTVGQDDGPEGQFELLFNVKLWEDRDELV